MEVLYEIEWVPFNSLLWNTNDSYCKVNDFYNKPRFLVTQNLLSKYIQLWQQQ